LCNISTPVENDICAYKTFKVFKIMATTQCKIDVVIVCLTADACDPNPCAPHGTCAHDIVNISGYTCTCDAGWTGTNCQTGQNW